MYIVYICTCTLYVHVHAYHMFSLWNFKNFVMEPVYIYMYMCITCVHTVHLHVYIYMYIHTVYVYYCSGWCVIFFVFLCGYFCY